MVAGTVRFVGGVRYTVVDAGGVCACVMSWVIYAARWSSCQTPVRHFVWLLFLYRALDSHPVFPSHVASGRCVLSAAVAGAPAGVVSAFAEPRGWCAGAVLDVAWCAVCASAAPSSWRIGGCAGCCQGRLTVLLSTRLCPQAVHTRCPDRSPYVPFPLTADLPLMGSRSCCANSPSGLRETAPT